MTDIHDTHEVPLPARDRLLNAATDLLIEQVPSAVSTRAITDRAAVTAPTLYHHFGDKDSLLEEAAVKHFAQTVADHASTPAESPLGALAQAWDALVDYGRSYPQLFDRLFGTTYKTQPGLKQAEALYLPALTELAQSGALTASVEASKRSLLAANVGAAILAIGASEEEGGLAASRSSREILLRSFVSGDAHDATPCPSYVSAAVALSAALQASETSRLTPAEYALFLQWLDRLASAPQA